MLGQCGLTALSRPPLGDTISWRESTAHVEPGSCSNNNTSVHFFLQMVPSLPRHKPATCPTRSSPLHGQGPVKALGTSNNASQRSKSAMAVQTSTKVRGRLAATTRFGLSGPRISCPWRTSRHFRLAPRHRHPHSSSGSCTRHPRTPERTGVPT
jgi:hypothetical protein